MADVLLIKRNGKLEASDPISAETLAGIRDGEQIRCKIGRARNGKHHRLYWTLLKMVWEQQDTFPTVKNLHRAIKIATGLYTIVNVNGREVIDVQSTDFAAMKQDEFSQYYDRVVRLICERILPGLSDDEVKRQVLEIMDGRTGR
jgi:hypothetical protein